MAAEAADDYVDVSGVDRLFTTKVHIQYSPHHHSGNENCAYKCCFVAPGRATHSNPPRVPIEILNFCEIVVWRSRS